MHARLDSIIQFLYNDIYNHDLDYNNYDIIWQNQRYYK